MHLYLCACVHVFVNVGYQGLALCQTLSTRRVLVLSGRQPVPLDCTAGSGYSGIG